MSNPDNDLKNWFDYLRKMRDDAATLSNDTAGELDQFAAQQLSDLLPDQQHQDQYAQLVTAHTGLLVSSSDISGAKTPLDLLNTIAPNLTAYVLSVFQVAANDVTSSPPVFQARLASQVYPNDASRTNLCAHLQNDLPPAWFPAAKLLKLRKMLLDSASTVQQCVTLLSAL